MIGNIVQNPEINEVMMDPQEFDVAYPIYPHSSVSATQPLPLVANHTDLQISRYLVLDKCNLSMGQNCQYQKTNLSLYNRRAKLGWLNTENIPSGYLT